MNFDYHGVWGVDISTWQDSPNVPGVVDFQKMRAAGARFVIVKAGQGNWSDPDFVTNWANAKGVLPRATYFYFDNRYPPKEQAQKYFDIIKGDMDGMCWLDLEDRQAGLYAGWQSWYDFIERLKALYPGVRLGIYTGFYYWMEYITYATRAQRDYFGQYPLWLAWYSQDPLNPTPETVMVPLPWLSCDLWQTGTPAIGERLGVESREIDYNIFNGDEAKYRQFFGGVTEPQPGETMAEYKIIWPNGANERKGPSVWDAPTGTVFPAGAVIQVVSVVVKRPGLEEWGKLANGYYVALIYDSPRAVLVEPEPPAPEPEIPVRVLLEFEGGVQKWYVAE